MSGIKPDQSELFGGDEGGFALVVESSVDGDRVAREAAQTEEDRAAAERNQLRLI